jgi:hypothetical protein
MKNSILLIALLFIAFTSYSQESVVKVKKDTSTQMKTLFKLKKLNSFGLSLQSQTLLGKGGPERGLTFQVHLNNKFSIGLTSFHSYPRKDDPNGYAPEPRRRFNAFTLEATPVANKVFHLSFPVSIGRIQEDFSANMYPQPLYSSYIMPEPIWHNRFEYGPKALGIQPGINLEVNLFKYIKAFGGMNYRFAVGEEKTPGMSRGAGTLGVKVGVFDKRIRGK